MADRYWVGGTANWDATAGTKWALTSGGAGGQAVPTAADDVYFDAASGAVTCTLAATSLCRELNFTGFTGTFAGASTLSLSGGLIFVSGMTLTYSGLLNFVGTSAFNFETAGKTLAGNIQLNSVSLVLTLQSALTTTGILTVASGTFDTGNYNVTATQIVSTANNVRTLNLGSSTITLSGTVAFNLVGSLTSLTINAGTSTINATASGAQISTGGTITPQFTFYNLNFTSTATGTRNISGGFTFNDISVAGPASVGVVGVTLTGITINGTLSTTGTAGNRRVWFQGVTYGIAQTLTINSAPSLTDADFRDIYVIGTAAPISGTRIGDLGGIRGITASTPKTVYWNLAGAQSWSADGWSDTSTGTPSTDFFPLAQDTATFTDAGSVTGTISLDIAVTYMGSIDMSGRTSAMTLAISHGYRVYGNWTNGSGVTFSGIGLPTFAGRKTQVITSAGKTFSCPITVDSYGGTVELADALNIGGNTLTFNNGTFDTKGYNVTAGSLSSNNSNVREIKLGASTVTLSSVSSVTFTTSTNLTFDAGTSSIVLDAVIFNGGGQTFYDVSLTNASGGTSAILQSNTFNNLSITAPSSANLRQVSFAGDQTITGTLTVAGATAVRRIFLRSNTIGTTRTLTVGTLSADDCDFRDITIAGTAAGGSPTRAGDCGGNSGVTFPVAKTVYWNLAGTQNWSATGWAPSSGGTPDINEFPLAQDTAVFDEAGSAGTVTVQTFNIGAFDASARTSAMTLTSASNNPTIYGNWTFGTGVTSSSTTSTITFSGRSTSTITSNGITFGCPITIDCATGTVQLADANSAQTLTLTSGAFDAVSYNVTAGTFNALSAVSGSALKMGSGTWTLSGNINVWQFSSVVALYKGTANIVLSSTSGVGRAFAGGNQSYNKLTIGGATGTSPLTITGNNQFTELDSTKTVAHTIAFGTTAQTFGKWSVTGTAGNVVTLTGTGVSHILAGACTDGIDYLAMGSLGFSASSPAEFYAGANSTGTAAAPVYRTAKPADSVRYWVGGTGNWNDTTYWSTSSGGAGGADLPRSHDDVVFDSLSNATAYTATVNAITGGNRCKALTIAGPASGNVTLAGSTALFIHDDITLPATGLTRTYSGAITLSGSAVGRTITTNGIGLQTTAINGVGCEWTLGGAINASLFDIINGSFVTNNYSLTTQGLASTSAHARTITLGSSVISISGFNVPVNFGTTSSAQAGLTFNAGTSEFSINVTNLTFSGNDQTFYNVSFTSTTTGAIAINGINSFNNLSFTGITSNGPKEIALSGSQTITGTLTLSAGTNATLRQFVRSNSLGTTRTLTCAAFSGTDVDFRDITIAGAAAPVSGTRLGDCKGNSGITFVAGVDKYWNLAAGGSWSAIGWATSSGGTPDVNNFPLAQDTCIFEATGLNSGATVTMSASFNIGTIDMSARTGNTMTLSTNVVAIYGNWINGTGVTLSGATTLTFAGRGSQTITSAGRTFSQSFNIDTPGGSVTLQDAFETNRASGNALLLTSGTFDANDYNVTLSSATSALSASGGSNASTLAIGSGTWTIAGSGSAMGVNATNLTVTGTGVLRFTSASAKILQNTGVVLYSGITIDQAGAGSLTIRGTCTFDNITNSYSSTGASTIIFFNAGTYTVNNFTATGEAGRVLTLQTSSAGVIINLILTSGTVTTIDYLTITGLRAYDLSDTWYAGANSTNNGSLGWLFEAGVVGASTIFYGANNITSIFYGSTPVSAIYYGAAQVF